MITKEKRNIIFMTPSLECGGVSSLNLGIMRILKEQGFNIIVVTHLNKEHEWYIFFDDIVDDIYRLYEICGDDTVKCISQLLHIIREHDIDYICGINSDMFLHIIKEVKNQNLDVINVSVLHGAEETWFFDKAIQNDGYIDAYIGITDKIRHDLIKHSIEEDKITIIYNGVDLNYFTNDLYDRRNNRNFLTVSFLGRFVKQKIPLDFLSVAQKMQNNASIKFLMGGDGELYDQCQKYIVEHNITNVIMEGDIIYPQGVKDFLQETDVLVLTSLKEGFPIVALEAMAMCVPVVSTDVGELKTIIINNKTGYLGDIGDIDFFVDKINMYNNDRNILYQHGKNARNIVKSSYNITETGAKYVSFFLNYQ